MAGRAPSPRRSRRKAGALPPLPHGLRPRDLERGALEAISGHEVLPQLTSEAALARFIARVEARLDRYRRLSNRASAEVFQLGLELALIGRLPPKIGARWRTCVGVARRRVEAEAERLAHLDALLLALEPEPHAWLRRQLNTLTP